jgi:single-strand DNA-binding protein
MSDLNNYSCTGRLGADPESRRFTDGKPVVNMRIAVSDTWRDRNTGTKKENTLWLPVVITAEGLCKIAEQYLKKGSRVALSGSLRTRSWEKDGQKREVTELVLTPFQGTMTMLDGASGEQRQERHQDPDRDSYGNVGSDFENGEIPF